MKRLAIVAIVAGISMSVNASEMEGKKLFEAKCAMCHSMSRPDGKTQQVAPPARGVVFHMSEAFDSKSDMIAHINDFVLDPTAEKAICKSVKRFGLMPSQKGAVSKEELATIADWMVNNYSMNKAEHDAMRKKNGRGQGMGKGQGKGKGKKSGKNCAN